MASTIWKGHLTFGLVSIPIKLFRAARAEKIHMHRLERNTGARVRQVFVPAEEQPEPEPAFVREVKAPGPSLVAAKTQSKSPDPAPSAPPVPPPPAPEKKERTISGADMVKGFEFEKGKYVAFESEELESLAPKTSSDMQIIEFVHFDEVDPIYLESSYYVAADKGGEKPYSLLFETLRKTGFAAIAEFVMHRRDQTIILRASGQGMVAHTLFYEDEVKRENAFPANPDLLSDKELDLAVKLVDALAATFDPLKFKDKYRERLQQAIAAKVESEPIAPAVGTSPNKPVVDIMEALRESLRVTKKPAARESETPAPRAKEKPKVRTAR